MFSNHFLARCNFIVWIFCFFLVSSARADYTIYTLPKTSLSLLVEGNVTYNPGGTISVRHPRGSLYFNAADVKVMKVPTRESVYGRKLAEATGKNSVDALLEVSKWALHNGMLKESKSLLSQAWKVDPNHAQLRKLAGLMQYLNRSVPDNSEIESKARELCGGKTMEKTRSKHFLLLHDKVTEKDETTRKTRTEMRLELLETVYESYFLTFAFEGLFLKPPSDPMPVVLFSNHADFMQLERRLEMQLRQVAGFYLPKENISIFYDSGTTPEFKQLERLNQELTVIKNEMKRTRVQGGGEIIRLANTIELLVDIQRESEDIQTVSHEAVHQLAGNTDLFPREGVFVRWVHEGLASFFESSKLARWSGVGVVDEQRIGYYRLLEPDPIRGGIEFIVSDLGFAIEGMLGTQLPAYGQAWSLTHFLFNERFDQLIKFYRELQKYPEEMKATDDESFRARAIKLVEIFDASFGDRTQLELEWRRYMRTLKTDTDELLEEMK